MTRDANGIPMVVITADDDLSDAYAYHLHETVEDWLKAGGPSPLVITSGKVHVSAEQPDGSWVRLCHDHAEEVPA
jgi:hypothetical protein